MDTNDTAIQVEGLGKRYQLGQTVGYRTLQDGLSRIFHRKKKALDTDYMWALKDISFEVKQGEAIGIIGRNGAGKTTLLKVLTRITHPTEGYATIRGRVGSLLEVGTGFHGELTGRENIYLNGAVLGMKRAEISHKLDDIIDFAGDAVKNFIDTPLKRYSSGMVVRLAFAVAAQLEPDILMVDEVLSVGDIAFQRKGLGKMEGVAKQGRTVLFVSHRMDHIATLCSRSILLENGHIISIGDTKQVISDYYASISAIGESSLRDRTDRKGQGRVRFIDTWIENQDGNRIETLVTGQEAKFVLLLESTSNRVIKNLDAGVAICTSSNQYISGISTYASGQPPFEVGRATRIELVVPKWPLNAGKYYYNCNVNSYQVVWQTEDHVEHAGEFMVDFGDYHGIGQAAGGLVLMEHYSKITPA